MIAGMTGCSPIIIAVECTSGIVDGGKTGVTALTAAFLFALSLFFTPVLGDVPEAASAPVLILIGTLMMRDIGDIEWHDIKIALPSFLIVALMPLSHSISNGIWFGLAAFLFMEFFTLPVWSKWYYQMKMGKDDKIMLRGGAQEDDATETDSLLTAEGVGRGL